MFQAQSVSTHHKPSMLIGFQFITFSCHFNNDPLTQFTCQFSYQTHHLSFMNHATYTSYSIIYMSLIIHSYPTKTNHPEINKHPITALSRPAPHSGETVSLRRVPFTQARLKKAHRNQRGISLRRDPSRLGEILARSKIMSGSPGRPLAIQGLSESLFISPRRDWLAWARLAGLATVFLRQSLVPAPQYVHTTDIHIQDQHDNTPTIQTRK